MTLRTSLLAAALALAAGANTRHAAAHPPPEGAGAPGATDAERRAPRGESDAESPATDAEGEAREARLELNADTVVGTGRRAATGEAQAEHATAASTVLEASYLVAPALRAGLLLPFSHESIAPAGGDAFTQNALGNVALSLAYQRPLSRPLSWRAGLTLAAPTAAGDRFAASEARARAAEANEWAALTRAYAEDELFAPHHAGAVPALGLDYRGRSVEFGGAIKVPLLAREGGADPSRESGLDESPLAVEVIPSAYGFYDIRPAHLALGASAYAVYFAVDEVHARRPEAGRSEPKVQPVVEPEARVTLRPFRLALGYILPLGGRLGGHERHAGGVRFALGAEI